jgi:predicted AAA+ superfamily ATPase
MSDTGLLTTKAGLSISVVFGDENNIFKGPLTENYVACALTANGLNLRFWRSKGEAEVDFLVEKGSDVIPIEVKAKDKTTSKSLSEFTNKHTNTPYSIRISAKNFGFVNNIKSVQLYATFCITKESI